jgi:hypothetical protein
MCETGHSLPSSSCRPPRRSTVSAESAAISGPCHVRTEMIADAKPSRLKYLVIASHHYLQLTTARLGGLAGRSRRDASSADRHWEATAIEGLVRATCRGCGR